RLDDLRQQLTGAPDERLTLRVLVRAWRLADEHQFSRRAPDAEHHLAAAERRQLASCAERTDVITQLLKSNDRIGHQALGTWHSRNFRRLALGIRHWLLAAATLAPRAIAREADDFPFV